MVRWLTASAGCLLLATPGVTGPPKPVESEWLITTMSMFFIKGDVRGRDGSLIYQMEFQLRKPVTESLYVTVDFENPEDRGTPFFAELELAPGVTTFKAESEPIRAIRNREKYLVRVWIFADVKRRHLLGTHEQPMQFRMPRDLLEQIGVTLL